jgi:hypothetical protein
MWEMVEYEEKENIENPPGLDEKMVPSEETPAVGD